MHQVDPAGDRLHPVHHGGELVAAGVGVAGVQAEADLPGTLAVPVPGRRLAEVTDRVPQAGQGGHAPGHRVVAARGVLDQQRDRARDPLHRLAPVVVADVVGHAAGHVTAVHHEALRPDGRRGLQLLGEKLAAGDPDPVVRARHVDAVRRVDVRVHARRRQRVAQSRRVTARKGRRVPALRVAEEELDDVGAGGVHHRQRVALAVVCTDANHGPSLATIHDRPGPRPLRPGTPGRRHCPVQEGGSWPRVTTTLGQGMGGRGPGQRKGPPWAKASMSPTKAATRPVTMTIRCSRVAEIIWA